MGDGKNPYTQSNYYSDEESDGGYNPSAVSTNGAMETNEYNVVPRLSPNTPVYHPTKSMPSHPDDDSESLSSVEQDDLCKKSETSHKIRYDLTDEGNELHPPSKVRKVILSDVDKGEAVDKSDDAGDNLGLFDDDSDDGEKADGDKHGADFEGFDGDEPGAKDMIADIFGESDAEGDGDFEGFAENEVEKEVVATLLNDDVDIAGQLSNKPDNAGDDKDNESGSQSEGAAPVVSIFEQIVQKLRNERRRRRRKNVDFLNDMDDIIRDIVNRMRDAAEEDRRLLANNKPAIKKIGMLKDVENLLLKADIGQALIDNGMLTAIAEWLSPVAGRILPAISIRECLLKHLKEFHIEETDLLKESGLGKAVMFIYRHPMETPANKKRAYSLITAWSRPIFKLPLDYSSISREDRKEMDLQNLNRHRVTDVDKKSKEEEEELSRPLKPGDEGFIARARVPQPSNKDYVIRPKWNVPAESTRSDSDDEERDGPNESRPSASAQRRRRVQPSVSSGVSSTSRLEKHIKILSKAAEMKKKRRFVRAVKMSVEGRNMSL
nr:protein iws1 [Hymenolepis microstoma]